MDGRVGSKKASKRDGRLREREQMLNSALAAAAVLARPFSRMPLCKTLSI